VGPRCSFCGASVGPFLQVEGAFKLLMCQDCQAARGVTSNDERPGELVVAADPREPWSAWRCPIEGCGYEVVLPWWLVGHTAAEHPGWTATWVGERMRVVYRRGDDATPG
jgi:hypothetical protein